jgi:thioester reductase-like protein
MTKQNNIRADRRLNIAMQPDEYAKLERIAEELQSKPTWVIIALVMFSSEEEIKQKLAQLSEFRGGKKYARRKLLERVNQLSADEIEKVLSDVQKN